MNDYKLILATRHLTRDGKSERITPMDFVLGGHLRSCIDDLAKEYNLSSTAITSGFSEDSSVDIGRTENTAEAFGYLHVETNRILSFSPDNDFKTIPWEGNFADVVKALKDKWPGTIKIAQTHGNLYKRIVSEMDPSDARHLFTHGMRPEAAIAYLNPKIAEKLGDSLGYGETLALRVERNYNFEPAAIIRRDGIHEVR